MKSYRTDNDYYGLRSGQDHLRRTRLQEMICHFAPRLRALSSNSHRIFWKRPAFDIEDYLLSSHQEHEAEPGVENGLRFPCAIGFSSRSPVYWQMNRLHDTTALPSNHTLSTFSILRRDGRGIPRDVGSSGKYRHNPGNEHSQIKLSHDRLHPSDGLSQRRSGDNISIP